MDRQTLAEAVGEKPPGDVVFIPGADFDPGDEDDVAAVRAAGERHRYDRMRAQEEEIAALREERDALAAEVERLLREQDDDEDEAEEFFAPDPRDVTDGLDMPSYES